jgi:hypothetical protein
LSGKVVMHCEVVVLWKEKLKRQGLTGWFGLYSIARTNLPCHLGWPQKAANHSKRYV